MHVQPRMVPAAVALAASLLVATGPVLAADTFTSPIRIGFPSGDDWEPAIAADDFGHVYALWTHYVGFGGGSSQARSIRPARDVLVLAW